jgi:hypothetical protein
MVPSIWTRGSLLCKVDWEEGMALWALVFPIDTRKNHRRNHCIYKKSSTSSTSSEGCTREGYAGERELARGQHEPSTSFGSPTQFHCTCHCGVCQCLCQISQFTDSLSVGINFPTWKNISFFTHFFSSVKYTIF